VGEEEGIDFSAGLCEMKPGRAIAINNDKNNPIRRLFDLSAPIFRASSIRLITILFDLGGEPSREDPGGNSPVRAGAIRAASARDRVYRIARSSNCTRDDNLNYRPLCVGLSLSPVDFDRALCSRFAACPLVRRTPNDFFPHRSMSRSSSREITFSSNDYPFCDYLVFK
jgi:hypothetical protein